MNLGFNVFSPGARVNAKASGTGEDGWEGWSKKYMLDVGFGGHGPIQPMLLDPSAGHTQHVVPVEARLVHENILHDADPNQKLWQYQHRVNPQSEWQTVYCFVELEFVPEDHEIMNFWASQGRKSWFMYQIVAVKKIFIGNEVGVM